ncbi:MAG: hypothetical protein GY795_28325, partial [Desulfobacterales bacterium]|nr:hypothetical protein [Desulfobacterales bacterium]
MSDSDGILLYGDRIIVPLTSQKEILKIIHIGHPGTNRSLELYSDAYFWPGRTERVKESMKRCRQCSLTRKNAITHNPLASNIP